MLELLNQLDGFSPNDKIKFISATNRPNILDPALLRSGRLDRQIEFPFPNEKSRAQILKIHYRKISVAKETVNYVEIARNTNQFNDAQLNAVWYDSIEQRRNILNS
ncbi:unnamed protein product [Paramecium pentaurelia]|uniref:ATPase AAA-type core domain-containing protein n=1 Tax=Paramecium pentaurelia TaxID=43138 RepID=A0A8S1UWS9_9CILI|nr:unnamed protein product [Paramecium pentaurelia]